MEAVSAASPLDPYETRTRTAGRPLTGNEPRGIPIAECGSRVAARVRAPTPGHRRTFALRIGRGARTRRRLCPRGDGLPAVSLHHHVEQVRVQHEPAHQLR